MDWQAAHVIQAFRKHDVDGSGHISKEVLRQLASWTDVELDGLLQIAGCDRVGHLSYNKLVAWCFHLSQASTSKLDNKWQPRFNIEVASVPPPPADDSELIAFKEKYIDNTKIEKKSEEGKARKKDDLTIYEIQLNRYAWLQDEANLQVFINILRVSGVTDIAIQAMCDGLRPLNFTESAYAEFCTSLDLLGRKLEEEFGWRNVRFMQSGSSVLGYSSNPLKGKRDEPSKITDNTKSDVDIAIIGDGVGDWAKKWYEQGKFKVYKTTLPYEQRGERPLYGSDDPKIVCKTIADWVTHWEEVLQGGVQLTYAEHPNPMIYPWAMWVHLPAK